MPVRRALVSFVLCLVAAISIARPSPSIGADSQLTYLPDDLVSSFVIAEDAVQCSLLDTVTHNDAGVLGQDGGASYAHNGVVYWAWGDTFLTSPPNYIPNSVATSDPGEAPRMPSSGASATDTACFTMQYKETAGVPGEALPVPAASCVDWPTQFASPDDTSSQLYFIYARQSVTPADGAEPCGLVPGAGIASLDTASLDATRLDAEPTWLDTPGSAVQVTSGTTIRADDGDGEYLYLFLVAGGDPEVLGSTTAVALARVEPAAFGSPAEYRYWTSGGWVTWETFQAISVEDNNHYLWRQPDFGIHAGLTVSYSTHLHKWVATYATNLVRDVRIRTADRLTGPWSQETRIVDCIAQLAVLPPRVTGSDADYPCYGGMIHDEFTSPDGLTIYVSFSRNNWAGGRGDYRTYLRRVNLASPMYDWVDEGGAHTLAPNAPAGDVAVRQGLAFFESEVPLPGYVPVYASTAQPPLPKDTRYSTSSVAPPGFEPHGVAFYAPEGGTAAGVDQRVTPVRSVLLSSGHHAYTVGPVPAGAVSEGFAFNAVVPNLDVDADGLPNAVDNCPFNSRPDQTDTDGDGAGDVCDQDDDNDNIPDLKVIQGPFPFASMDNCRTLANTDQSDVDGDGLGDTCEVSLYHTDPRSADTDQDACGDASEIRLGLSPLNPYDFYSVPVGALFALVDPMAARKSASASMANAQAVLAYFKVSAKAGTPVYEQDLNVNGIKDGLEYDRSIIGPGQSGAPDGKVTAQDAQLAFAQTKLGYRC